MRILVLILQLTCAVWLSAAEVMGFEGFGSATPGGNNGAVVTVTSLQDTGPGTLREALSGSNRRVVFSVGGTINLQSALEIRNKSFITIDGSTAPGAGITLQGNGFYIRNSHDIVVTHMRIRDSVSDGITLWDGSSNVVIDHCSVTNSVDGNIDITEDTRNVTVSWSILGDTRSNSFELKTKGMLVTNFDKPAVTNLSLHHNLFINHFQRSPQISTAGLVDIRNNVVRDWGAYGIRMRAGAWGNIINNVFHTNNNPADAVVLESTAGPVYIHGNLGPGAGNVDALTTAAAAFNVAPVSTDAVTEVEQTVFSGAGAFPRDSIDTLLAGSAGAGSCASDNLARCATASASSVWSSSYSADKANDGNGSTRWNSASGNRAGAWLALDFGAPTTFDTVVIREAMNRITGYSLQYWDGSAWRNIVTGTIIGANKTHNFAPLTAQQVRILIASVVSGSSSVTPTLYEFEIYK